MRWAGAATPTADVQAGAAMLEEALEGRRAKFGDAHASTAMSGALLGVQTGPDSPETGFGSAATHGSHYLFSYQPNVATGTLQFSFATPTSAFGLNLIDVGEVTGEILLQTNNGGQSLVARNFGSGNAHSFGGEYLELVPNERLRYTDKFDDQPKEPKRDWRSED